MTALTPHSSAFARLFPRFDWRAGIILGFVAVAACVMSLMPAIHQSLAFHDFADKRSWLGVPNFMDVVSNAPFALAALLGIGVLFNTMRANRKRVIGSGPRLFAIDRACILAFFIGVGLTAVGSAYYHLAPGNERLVWDRLPMILTFLSLLVMLIAERVSPKTAAWLLGPMLIAGAASVLYWRTTEHAGHGDLRPYFLIEAAGLLSVLLLVCLYPSRYLPTKWLGVGMVCYGLAVAFEQLDRPVWSLWHAAGVELVSGHTIKHCFAAAGAFAMVWAIRMGTSGKWTLSRQREPDCSR